MSWGAIVGVLADLIAILIFIIEARRFGLKKAHIVGLCLLFPVAGYNGARVFKLAEGLLFYYASGSDISSGLRMPGAIMGIIAIFLIYAGINKLPI